MRNLKRVLSLVLAVMMVIGMMVISTSAANTSYVDDDEIVHPEAVNLLKTLGVMSGNPNGTFSPKGILQREQMAKMAYVVANQVTTDQTIYEGGSSLTDLGSTWAEGYIVWCALPENQFITGNPDGTFKPKDTLTVGQACAIMLRVLGYDNTLEGLTGGNYAVNSLSLATKIGLTAGCVGKDGKGLRPNDPITRDDAAQLTFNALFTNRVQKAYATTMVNGQVVRYVSGYLKAGDTGYDAAVTNWASNQFSVTPTSGAAVDGIGAHGYATVGGVEVNGLVGTPEMIGQTVTYYTLGGKAVASHATSIVAGTIDGSDWSTLVGAGKAYTLASVPTYYTNGAAGSASDIKAGSVVELINSNPTVDAKIEVVRITNKTVAKLSADPTTRTSGKDTLVTIAGIPGVANVKSTSLNGWENLKKNDVVLYVTIGGVTYFEEAAVKNGSVAGNHASKGALIDGDYYLASALDGKTYTDKSLNDPTKTYNFYLDNGGNIVMAVLDTSSSTTTPAPEKEKGYLVVTDVALVEKSGDGSFESAAASQFYFQAKVVKSDGTKDTVVVDSVDGVKIAKYGASVKIADLAKGGTHYTTSTTLATASTGFLAKNAVGQSAEAVATTGVTNKNFYGLHNAATVAATTGKGNFYVVTTKADITNNTAGYLATEVFYKYTVESEGHVTLTSVENNAVSGAPIAAGAAFTTGLVGNADTVFLYKITETGKDDVYQSVTGIANTMTTGTNNAATQAVKEKGVVTYAYITVDKANIAAPEDEDLGDMVYVTQVTDYTTIGTGETATYVITALLNGEEKELTISNDPADTSNALVPGKVYKATVSETGVYTLAAATPETEKVAINAIGGGVAVVNSNEPFRYEDDTPAFVVDGIGTTKVSVTATTVSALELDGNDKVVVVTVPNTTTAELAVVYVTKVSNVPDTVAIGTTTNKALTVSKGDLTAGAGAATGYKKTDPAADDDKHNVKLTVTVASGTSLVSVHLNGSAVTGVTSGSAKDDFEVALGTNTLVVVVKDDYSEEEVTHTYTFVVTEPAEVG